ATEKSTWRPCSSALATATCRSGSVSKPGSVGCIAPRPDWPLLAAWFKSWVFQVTVRTVPCLDGGGSFCRRTDSRLRNAGSGSSPACLTRAGGVDLSADTDREKRASFDRQASATDSVSFLGLFQPKANKTVFFFVSFHRGATQSGILFLVSIERGTSRRVYHRRPWLSDVSQLGGAPCRFLARPGCGTRRCVGPTRARGKKGDSLGRTTPEVSHSCVLIQTQ